MKHALIVGAGIGGLAAGVALQRAGWSVRIFERAANSRELGFALNLAPNAMAALGELGVADDIGRARYAARRVEFRGARGRVLRLVDARHVAMESVVAMRPVVHGALWTAVGSDAISLSREAVSCEGSDAGVTLRFRDGTAAGDLLVGADGIGSVIRRQLHPDEPPPQPSGYAAVRGAVDDIGEMLGELDGVLCFAPRLEAAVVRAGARSAYWYMSLLSREVPAGVAAMCPFEKVARSLPLRQSMAKTIEHQGSPYEQFSMRQIVGWMLGAAVKGRIGVMRDFLALGQRASFVQRELRHRQQLAAQAADGEM